MINCILAVFKFEGKRLLDRKSLIILSMLLVFVLGFFLYNISEFKDKQEQKRLFQDFEKKRVEQFYNYRIYGFRGFRLFYQSDPISIFFINSVPIPDMNAFADSAEQLKIYKPVNTKTVFDLRQNWFNDSSGILLLIGSLLILFFGYKALKSAEYLRLPTSITGYKNYFWAVYFARGLWLLLILIVFLACLILLAALIGITIAIDQYLLVFLLVSYGLTMLIFSVGFWCGTWKSAATGMATALIIWMVFIFFIPTLHNVVTANNAKTMTPAYQFEMEKLIIFMNWEKIMIEKEGVMKIGDKSTESVKKRMLEFKENELKKIQAMEEDQIAQLNHTKKLYQLLASFFPTTFYQSVNNEISSRGYDNLVDFCRYALEEKLKFIGIVIEKEYFSNYSKVEQFNAGNANVYTARPKLPEFFLLGILFNLLWIAAFLIPAYYRFKKGLAELPEKKQEESEPNDVHLKKADLKGWRVYSTKLSSQLYNLLSNNLSDMIKKGYSLKVSIEDQLLNTAKKAQEFLYLGDFTKFPGHLRTGWVIDLLMDLMNVDKTKRKEIKSRFSLDALENKKIKQLETSEVGRIYLGILEMKKFPIYLIDDIASRMHLDFCIALRQKCIDLFDEGAIVLFLSSEDDFLSEEKERIPEDKESCGWFKQIGNQKIQQAAKNRHDDSEEFINGDPDEEE